MLIIIIVIITIKELIDAQFKAEGINKGDNKRSM